jgi:transcriptional regulator with XRE-family HTH domain
MSRQEEELRIARLLEAVFRAARIPAAELERRTGLASSTLARIFRGEVELKFRHVFSVLDALAVAPGEFFRLAYKERPGRGELLAQEVLALLGDNLPARQDPAGGEGSAEPLSPMTDDELDRRILQALREQGIGEREPRQD